MRWNQHTMQQQVNEQKAYLANSILSVYSSTYIIWMLKRSAKQ